MEPTSHATKCGTPTLHGRNIGGYFAERTVDRRKIRIHAQIMSTLRTIVLALAALFAAHGSAQATSAIDMIFAGCVGRMSAEMEHAWLLGEDGEEAAERREVFLSLLEATMVRDRARDLLAHRIAAKMSQASLLTLASFADDETRAIRARELSLAEVASCRRLLLDS